MSLFWSQWGGKYWNSRVIKWLAKDWKISLLRCPMGVEAGGYLQKPRAEQRRITRVVDVAIRLGIYVIIDWHDHNATAHSKKATEFFDHMSKTYGKYPNVFFEVYNEPIQQLWATEIRPYCQSVVETVRKHTDNLLICGTRKWSQEVDEASLQPVKGKNVAYTLHFYAQSHKEELRVKARTAMANGVAIFVTEWGTCRADGNGTVDVLETKKWMEFLEEYNISDANWAISDKSEACSALQPKASVRGHWPVSHRKKHSRSTNSRLFAHHGHHGHHGHHARHHAAVHRGGLTVSGRLVRASLRHWSAIHNVWPAPAPRNASGPAPGPEDGDDDEDKDDVDDDDDDPRANKTTTTTTSQQDNVSAAAPLARVWALACSAWLGTRGLTASGRLVRASLREWSASHHAWGTPTPKNSSGHSPGRGDAEDGDDDDDKDDDDDDNQKTTTSTTSRQDQDIVSAAAPLARVWALACSACLAIGLSV
eukprot:CAMPEP_0177573988 /NCGR_PEP_ID=MMETSP0369-20130122/78815_1 /TAXON_ID=447022 ORGANISM="Scrippsiella hangoei-like, Strain SHHI-4" /NCGR_SAMPLE_ID=MMETSP0369 /ASSEMBLY_ACC=CAM_ASM_000364 /LENGTH=478 /DNA_ID=CAMNT_0019062125 /DNA_START=1 /DNA_END=1434 /DNA_ORIENTATION=+